MISFCLCYVRSERPWRLRFHQRTASQHLQLAALGSHLRHVVGTCGHFVPQRFGWCMVGTSGGHSFRTLGIYSCGVKHGVKHEMFCHSELVKAKGIHPSSGSLCLFLHVFTTVTAKITGLLASLRSTWIFFVISGFLFPLAHLAASKASICGLLLFAAGRIVGGFGAGAATVLVPLYLGRIAPLRLRGAIGNLHQVGTETANAEK